MAESPKFPRVIESRDRGTRLVKCKDDSGYVAQLKQQKSKR